MKIIAFDLGSTMAWASNIGNHRTIVTGCKTFTGSRAERLTAIHCWLEEGEEFNWRVDAVIYETPLTRGQAATRILWGIAGLVEVTASLKFLPVLDVAVPTIKKFATGSGHAGKTQMIAAARKFGYTGTDEHEADAVCLLRYAAANLERP